MNFMELIFGISSDGGNGALELLIFGAVSAAIAVIAVRRAGRRRPRNEKHITA